MSQLPRQRLALSGGTTLAFATAGDPSAPAILLIHGFPSSADTFRDLVPVLARDAFVIAPDLPGFGESEPLPNPTFDAFAAAVTELLASLDIGPRFLYLHDFGAPVALKIAMDAPDLVLGLIVQNANAHHSGFGPGWSDTLAFWDAPDPDNEAKATAHLTLAGTRDQYVAGLPDEVVAAIPPARWEEDWRVMTLPGRMETQRALIADYANPAARFDAIATYLEARQPPALMVWGRHDAFFDIAEALSWIQDLPRMVAHVLDGGHFLLETHAAPAAALMADFITQTVRKAA